MMRAHHESAPAPRGERLSMARRKTGQSLQPILEEKTSAVSDVFGRPSPMCHVVAGNDTPVRRR